MSGFKPRNHELALVAKNDCTRFKIRVVESEKRKLKLTRTRDKKLNRPLLSEE